MGFSKVEVSDRDLKNSFQCNGEWEESVDSRERKKGNKDRKYKCLLNDFCCQREGKKRRS